MKPSLCLGYAPKMPVPPLHLHARLLHGRGQGWPGDPKNWLINLWIQRISLASQPSIFTHLNLSTPFDESLINCVNFLSKMLPVGLILPSHAENQPVPRLPGIRIRCSPLLRHGPNIALESMDPNLRCKKCGTCKQC